MDNTEEVVMIEDFIYDYIQIILHKEIDIDDTFLNMGLESMHIYKLYNAICDQYPDCIEISDIFEYPTIERLAEYIISKKKQIL